jgi:hypothetical protein
MRTKAYTTPRYAVSVACYVQPSETKRIEQPGFAIVVFSPFVWFLRIYFKEEENLGDPKQAPCSEAHLVRKTNDAAWEVTLVDSMIAKRFKP